MSGNQITRRSFLAAASAGAAVVSVPSAVARAAGANERISIGVIGTGDRGRSTHMGILKVLRDRCNVSVTAVCDVWKVNLDKAVAQAKQDFEQEPRASTRFEDLLALKDVDAVTIATCDSAHTPIMIAALKAGKDVYVEKPMSLDVAEAGEALDLARKHERVVQVGTQHRSNGAHMAARDVLATGVLGRISRITAARNFNHPRWARAFDDCKPQDVDWDAYLFNRKERPFDPKLLRCWHLYKDFTNGLSGLWGCHYIDAMHLMTGAGCPKRSTALGGTYVWQDGREHEDVFHGLWEYPEGFLYDWGMSLANGSNNYWSVHGTEGTLAAESGELGTRRWLLSNDGGSRDSKVEARKIEPLPSRYNAGSLEADHFANWIDCMRTRKRPTADILYGHQHSVATIMAAAALHEGKTYVYDPEKRRIRPA
ncbi:MAG TPA: Gfo/Idh/MocA family oxidoreductase [Phycisphaerae bacterium]|nr:Gfo/Idh/MocA family oxidoreductase [Phycisphaerae bacterium]